MAELDSRPEINDAVIKYGLSNHAALNSLQTLPWDSLRKLFSNLWSTDNPEGLVFMGVAENPLLHQEVAKYITDNFAIDPIQHLGYGVGPQGSPRLRRALASFFNSTFRAYEPVKESEVLVLPGVISVLDALTWSVCNEGEGIIVPLPYYTGFVPATRERSRGVLIPAPFQTLDGYKSIDDIFNPEMNRKSLEAALEKAAGEGIKARAVLISNPHNPIGRCYPKETLLEIARFCGRHGLHLISDEIFAQSVYETPNSIDPVAFNSILSLDFTGCIDPHLVHVAYGMGKDYSANGFRLAALHSRNKGLLVAVTSVCVFSWAPYITQDMWAKILEDEDFSLSLASKNRTLLGEHYAIITRFLDEHKISYYHNTNAGCYVWVDLRSYLRRPGETEESTSLAIHSLSPSDLEMYQDRERNLSKRCISGGVGISAGSSYFAEELGWFRITFTVDKEALLVGLGRLSKCLQELKAGEWE